MHHKKTLLHYGFLFLFTVLTAACALAGSPGKVNIKGTIRDKNSGEALPYANVTIKGTQRGTMTNTDGYFVLVDVPRGKLDVLVSYIGYETQLLQIDCLTNKPEPLKINLAPSVISVDGVTVYGESELLDISTKEISRIQISPRQLSSLPSLGEIDVFRSLQLLPGISGVSDGSSGLYVRGGTPDQNLVIFDGMTIYHVDHFFGFFSAFNADAVKDIQIYKGGFGAEYGGRLSSVIDLTGKTGDKSGAQFGYGINLLSANASFEYPISDKLSFLLTGRRSYTDFIQSGFYDKIYDLMTSGNSGGSVGQVQGGRMSGGMQTAEFQPSFYFYDLNSKLSYTPKENQILTLSLYSGKDNLDESQDFSGMGMPMSDTESTGTLSTEDITEWGNTGISTELASQWSDRFGTELQIAYSQYFSRSYQNSSTSSLTTQNDSLDDVRGFGFANDENNEVADLSMRFKSSWYLNQNHQLEFGTWYTNFQNDYQAFLNDTTQVLSLNNTGSLMGLFGQDTWSIKNLELTLGMRNSYFQPTSKVYWEPRTSFVYPLAEKLFLKGAWGHYYQFVNRITNEQVTEGSSDFWMLADDNLKPGFAAHSILGLAYETDRYLFSAEGYYKDLDNIVEFSRRYRAGADYGNRFFLGEGYAEGIEFLAQKKRGYLTGWLGYTLGKVQHKFDVFNDGNYYNADHDRRHEVNLVGQYTLGVWSIAATWVYASGAAYTAPESQYTLEMIDGETISYIHVSDKNANRLPDYHRLDLSLSRHFESPTWKTEIGLSVFNAYNRENTWYREYSLETTPVTVTDVNMLGFTPTVFVRMNLK